MILMFKEKLMSFLYSSGKTIVTHSLPHVKELIGNPGCKKTFETVIKKEDKKDTQIIKYQINLGSRSTETNRKPVSSLLNAKSWGAKYPKGDKNDGICWLTVESSIEKFVKLVQLGFPYRLGIKEGGNSQKHYKGNYGIAFDLDNDSSVTIDQTIAKLQELELHGIVHYSPSGNPENNKFRLIVLFNEFVEDYSKVNHLTKCIGSLLPNNAQQVHDPARFFYGSILEIPHIDYKTNDFKFLYAKYSQLREYIEEKAIKTPQINLEELDSDNLTVPQKFGIKFREWLEQSNECLGNFITKICEHFNLTLNNWHLHDSPGDNVEQWRGLDPIHPEESTTGSSFTVYHAQNGSYAYKADRVGAYGDLIDLWLRLKHHAWDVNGGVNSRHQQDYWLAFQEICDFLQVDWIKEFQKQPEQPKEEESKAESTKLLKQPKSETSQLKTSEVTTLSVEEAKKQVQTIWEDELVLNWLDCYLPKKEGSFILDPTRCGLFFVQEHKNKILFDSVQDCFWIKINNIWKRHAEKDFNGYVISFLHNQKNCHDTHNKLLITESFKSRLMSWFKYLSTEEIIKGLEPSWNHIPCLNGVFDVQTKALIPYSENTAFITHQLPYTRKKTKGSGIKALRAFLDLFFKDRRAIDDFLLWCAGVVQNQGYKTKQAVSLVGDSGSGKSTLCDLISNLLAPKDIEYEIAIVKDLDASKIFADDGLFNLQPLEHQRLIIISEFTGFTKNSTQGSNVFKKLVAGDPKGHNIVTPVKHSNQDRIFPFKGAFITNSQDYTKFKAEDAGINRRLMVLNVHKITEIRPDIFNPLKDFEILEDLWNYFLDFDLEDVFLRMEELSRADCNVDWKIASTTLMNQANNRYWSFANECIEIIQPESLEKDAPIPQASAKSCYDAYLKWCGQQGERNPGSQTAFGLGITKAIAHFTKLGTDDIKKRTSKGVVYQFIRIVEIK